MPVDIATIIPSLPQHNGGAVSAPPSALFAINSTQRGVDFLIDDFAARVAKKWKTIGYYYCNTNYTADVAADSVIGVAGADTTILYSADQYGSHSIDGLAWSYSGGVPVSGNIAVQSPSGTTIFSEFITGSGNNYITFSDPLRGSGNSSMYIKLNAGGSGIVGTLNIFGHRVS